jgi:type IV pilus assembly protein PilA
MQQLRARLGEKEDGFTLIELMVVVLIIAILIAIAIPTFLGARNRAFDKQAQSNVRNALVTEDEFYTDNQAYSNDNAVGGALDSLEPQLAWGTAAADQGGVIASTDAANTQTVILRSASKSGTTFCVGKIATGATAGTYYTKACTGSENTATVGGWSPTVTGGW